MSERVYIVQRNCGDYYCGCGGGHVVGVFTTLERAEAARGDKLLDPKVAEVPLNTSKWNADDYKDRAWT